MTTLKQKNQKPAGTPEVLMERFPYRYVITGNIELNGQPDCRIQEYNIATKRYRDIYLCDNQMQLMTAMEDKDYTLWLAGEQCYRKNVSVNHYNK